MTAKRGSDVAEEVGQVLYRVDHKVAHITLNTPQKLNALSVGPGSNREALLEALARADSDDAVSCVLISGAGKAFCSGADLTSVKPRETPIEDNSFFAAAHSFFRAVRECATPTVAAVHGLCIGAGVALIAQCDLVIAADDARFGLTEGAMGLPGATDLVPVIGPAWAKFLILTGDLLDASIAKQMGLVLATVPPPKLMIAARALADRIASGPRASARLNKVTINAMVDAMGREGALRAGRAGDVATAQMSRSARAPDGRSFRDILEREGPSGVRKVLARTPWFETVSALTEENSGVEPPRSIPGDP
jgi:enoyl-CoA hydratase/carnithine racemase